MLHESVCPENVFLAFLKRAAHLFVFAPHANLTNGPVLPMRGQIAVLLLSCPGKLPTSLCTVAIGTETVYQNREGISLGTWELSKVRL